MKTWDDFVKDNIKRNDCELNYYSTDFEKQKLEDCREYE